MEKDGCHGKGQLTLPFKCKKIVPDGGKTNGSNLAKMHASKIDETREDDSYLLLETPEKKLVCAKGKMSTNKFSVEKETRTSDNSFSSGSIADFPEKYSIIAIFFDKLVWSVRLLNLRKKPTTFHNISAQVEVLTKRKFMYHHLAQIKHIFPEAIRIEKVLIRDEGTACMVPEMKITILFDAVEICDDLRPQALREAFRARLLNFHSTHQEDFEIPEAELPEPFNCRSQTWTQMSCPGSVSMQIVSSGSDYVGSDFYGPSSLKKEFSHGNVLSDEHAFQLCGSHVPSKLGSSGEKGNASVPQSSHNYKNSPIRPQETPGKLILVTPELKMSKISSVDSPLEEVDCTEKSSTPSARKSLFFSPSKPLVSSDSVVCEGEQGSSVVCSDHQMEAETNIAEHECNLSHTIMEKMASGAASGIHTDSSNRKQELSDGLPQLFNSIRFIFQSVKSYSITKQELVHKILFHNDYEYEDTAEVEEQLNLLEKLVPEWICGKLASTGDLMYSVQRSYDPEAIHARLLKPCEAI